MSAILAILIDFSALAHGAHDIWAATLVYVFVLSLLIYFLFSRCWAEASPGISLTFLGPLTLLLAAVYMSYEQSAHPSESFLSLMDWCAAAVLFFIVANSAAVFDDDQFLLLISPVFIIELVVQIVQQILIYQEKHYFFKSYGSLINANILTGFLLFFIVVFLDKIRPADGKRKRFILLNGVFWLCLILAGSASALPLAVIGVVFGLYYDKIVFFPATNKRTLIGGTAVFALFVALLFYWKIHHPATMMTYSGPTRLNWWKTGLLMWKDRPFVGVGIGNFPSAYLAYKAGLTENTLFAHSLPIQLLSETGIVGFGAIVFFFIFWLRTYLTSDDAKKRRPYFIGVLLFLAYSMVNIGFEYLVNLLVAAIFMGLAVAPSLKMNVKPRRTILILLTGLLVTSAPWVISPFLASRNIVSGEMDLTAVLQSSTPAPDKLAQALRLFSAAADLDSRSSEAQHGWARCLYVRYLSSKNPADLDEARRHQMRAIELDRLNNGLRTELNEHFVPR